MKTNPFCRGSEKKGGRPLKKDWHKGYNRAYINEATENYLKAGGEIIRLETENSNTTVNNVRGIDDFLNYEASVKY